MNIAQRGAAKGVGFVPNGTRRRPNGIATRGNLVDTGAIVTPWSSPRRSAFREYALAIHGLVAAGLRRRRPREGAPPDAEALGRARLARCRPGAGDRVAGAGVAGVGANFAAPAAAAHRAHVAGRSGGWRHRRSQRGGSGFLWLSGAALPRRHEHSPDQPVAGSRRARRNGARASRGPGLLPVSPPACVGADRHGRGPQHARDDRRPHAAAVGAVARKPQRHAATRAATLPEPAGSPGGRAHRRSGARTDRAGPHAGLGAGRRGGRHRRPGSGAGAAAAQRAPRAGPGRRTGRYLAGRATGAAALGLGATHHHPLRTAAPVDRTGRGRPRQHPDHDLDAVGTPQRRRAGPKRTAGPPKRPERRGRSALSPAAPRRALDLVAGMGPRRGARPRHGPRHRDGRHSARCERRGRAGAVARHRGERVQRHRRGHHRHRRAVPSWTPTPPCCR